MWSTTSEPGGWRICPCIRCSSSSAATFAIRRFLNGSCRGSPMSCIGPPRSLWSGASRTRCRPVPRTCSGTSPFSMPPGGRGHAGLRLFGSGLRGSRPGARGRTAPGVPLSPYGLEKAVDEAYADLYARPHGYPTLGLRDFSVYGTRQDPASPYSGVIAKFLTRLARGDPLEVHGDGLQERDFVHVRDVARVNARALFGEIHGVVNVARGESVSVRELVCRLERAARRPLATVSSPSPRARFASRGPVLAVCAKSHGFPGSGWRKDSRS